MLFDRPQASNANPDDLNLLPPPSLNVPLWRSLRDNLQDWLSPEQLPPLQLTSKPVNVGMLVGDIIALPWFRTIFTNIGDVITPETLPPLQLESQPVDVDLISDQPGWWGSLLRNLADRLAPERLPPLYLTSRPVQPEMESDWLIVPRWSAVIDGPKAFLPDAPAPPRPLPRVAPVRTVLVDIAPLVAPVVDRDLSRELAATLRRTLHRGHIREAVWLGLATAEIIFLVALHFARI
jgi:hypothetical protein